GSGVRPGRRALFGGSGPPRGRLRDALGSRGCRARAVAETPPRGPSAGGKIFWIWLAFQSLGRFVISFLRIDKADAFGLYQAQLVSLVLIALSIPMVITLFRMSRTAPAATA